MDADKWSQSFQDMGMVKGMEEMVPTRGPVKTKPPEQLNCPRCNSTNTKFCYYNNYSLTQPRYFCKTCRRYWTEGGSLRNVPVGGGSRKNKRSIISNSSSSAAAAAAASALPKVPDLNPFSQNPKTHHKGQDLNLAFPGMQDQYLELPKIDNNDQQSYYSSCNNNNTSAMELFRNGAFIPAPASAPDSTTLYSNGFSMQDYKPALSFPINGRGGVQENGAGNGSGRVFFPFGEMKSNSSAHEVDDQNKEQSNSTGGYWNNGVLGGGSW